MMPRLFVRSLLVFVLALLAALPITAPFSTLDLADLDRSAPAEGGSMQQAKISSDKPIPDAARSLDLTFIATVTDVRRDVLVRAFFAPHLLDIPLRV